MLKDVDMSNIQLEDIYCVDEKNSHIIKLQYCAKSLHRYSVSLHPEYCLSLSVQKLKLLLFIQQKQANVEEMRVKNPRVHRSELLPQGLTVQAVF